MRKYCATAVLVVLCVLLAPTPARAWWGWLDNLSGPGPFNGAEFDYKILCFDNQPSPEKARATIADAEAAMSGQLREQLQSDLNSKFNKLPGVRLNPLQFESFDRSTGFIQSMALESLNRRELALFAASRINGILQTMNANQGKYPADVREKWEAARIVTRQAAVHKYSQPKVPLWASCTDTSLRESSPPSPDVAVLHTDRHPVVAIVLNYRDLANTRLFHFFSEVARPESSAYAGGDAIHLRIFEPKLSFPITGPWDFLDYQIGLGVYHFSSAGFASDSKSFHGWMFEPARFDFHVPGRLVDKWITKDMGPAERFWLRLPLSLSYSAGLLMFPGGISGNRFNATTPGIIGQVAGNEAVFEQGIVINVGRLFGQ